MSTPETTTPGWRSGTTGERPDRPGTVRAALMVAEREITAQIRSKSFIISTCVMLGLVLVSIVAGYFLGGQLADRRGDLRTLAFVVGAAGLLLMIVPWLRAPVLQLCARAGIRGGALLSALILFGAAALYLGLTVRT